MLLLDTASMQVVLAYRMFCFWFLCFWNIVLVWRFLSPEYSKAWHCLMGHFFVSINKTSQTIACTKLKSATGPTHLHLLLSVRHRFARVQSTDWFSNLGSVMTFPDMYKSISRDVSCQRFLRLGDNHKRLLADNFSVLLIINTVQKQHS